MLTFRPATGADYRTFYGGPAPCSLRGLVAERDGRLVGFAGYYLVGSLAHVFTNHADMTKREIVKSGREVVKMLKNTTLNFVAVSTGSDTALRHFGFEQVSGNRYRLVR